MDAVGQLRNQRFKSWSIENAVAHVLSSPNNRAYRLVTVATTFEIGTTANACIGSSAVKFPTTLA